MPPIIVTLRVDYLPPTILLCARFLAPLRFGLLVASNRGNVAVDLILTGLTMYLIDWQSHLRFVTWWRDCIFLNFLLSGYRSSAPG